MRRGLERRLSRSHLGKFKTIADYDLAWPTKIDRALVESAVCGHGRGHRGLSHPTARPRAEAARRLGGEPVDEVRAGLKTSAPADRTCAGWSPPPCSSGCGGVSVFSRSRVQVGDGAP